MVQERHLCWSKSAVLRPKANDGIWTTGLLPLAVILAFQQVDLFTVLVLSIGVWASSLIEILRMKGWFFAKLLALLPGSLTGALLFWNSQGLFPIYICLSMIACMHALLPYLIRKAPASFTIGEAVIVVQSIWFCSVGAYMVLSHLPIDVSSLSLDLIIVQTVLAVLLSASFLTTIFISEEPGLRSIISVFIFILVILFGLVYPVLFSVLPEEPFSWAYSYIFGTPHTVYLVLYWAVCFSTAVLCVKVQLQCKRHATTSVRKYFHILLLTVYIPGLIFDPVLLHFASVCVLIIFVLEEVLRLCNLPVISECLKSSSSIFLDDQDPGPLILSPIYLLFGCSVPLWLNVSARSSMVATANNAFKEGLELSNWAGLLAVGVGDTCAAAFGSKYGRHPWPGQKKTIEGTAVAILAQLTLATILFGTFSFIPTYQGCIMFTNATIVKCIVAVLATSLVEAFTTQIDNLVLPLLGFVILSI